MLSLFIARRLFRSQGKENQKRASVPTIRIATAGVAVGLAVMILSVAVVLGFKNEISTKMTAVSAHIEVLDYNALATPEVYPIQGDRSFIEKIRLQPGIKRVDAVAQKMGILKTESDFSGVTFKGLDAKYDTTFISTCIIEGRLPQLDGNSDTSEMAISRSKADELGIHIGDRVFAYFFEESIKMRRFTVTGIYQTHLKLYDDILVLTDFNTVARLNKWDDNQCSTLEIRLDDFSKVEAMTQKVLTICTQNPDPSGAKRTALNIKQHYPSIFSWLSLLDFNLVVILILMILVSAFTMISGLLILILERTSVIGTLKAIGASNRRVRGIFLWLATFIIVRALIYGNVIALALLFIQSHWGLIHLNPETYYVDTVPVIINPWGILGINIGTLILTILAIVAPSFVISRIDPAKTIRYE